MEYALSPHAKICTRSSSDISDAYIIENLMIAIRFNLRLEHLVTQDIPGPHPCIPHSPFVERVHNPSREQTQIRIARENPPLSSASVAASVVAFPAYAVLRMPMHARNAADIPAAHPTGLWHCSPA